MHQKCEFYKQKISSWERNVSNYVFLRVKTYQNTSLLKIISSKAEILPRRNVTKNKISEGKIYEIYEKYVELRVD